MPFAPRRVARRTARRTSRRVSGRQEMAYGGSQQDYYPDQPQQAPPAPVEEQSYVDELEQLKELQAKGVITEEEFQAKKKQILGL